MLSLLTQVEACHWQMRGMESLTATCKLKSGRGGLFQRPFQRDRDQGNGKFLKSKETSYRYEDLQSCVWNSGWEGKKVDVVLGSSVYPRACSVGAGNGVLFNSVITEDCQEQYGNMGGWMRGKAKRTRALCRTCLSWHYLWGGRHWSAQSRSSWQGKWKARAVDQSCFLNGSNMSKTAVLKLVVCMASE